MISLSRAEYASYNLEEALAQLKMEMVKIIGEHSAPCRAVQGLSV